MTLIKQDEISSLRSSTSIVEVISSYIPLTQRGKNYFGVCPFHEDHSPSMSVSAEKQMYKCFSCGAAGNVFTFLENYLHISFAEAVEMVAKRQGVSLSIAIKKPKDSPYKEEYELMEYTSKFYQNNLYTNEGKDALEYLEKRGLKKETLKEFAIGLALEQNMLSNVLLKKGYQEKMLLDLGVANKKDDFLYDVFKNRIIFPLYDLEGNVVGFSGRCYKEEITPKYINTKETYLFKKGTIFFHYHQAKDSIRLEKQVVVVEGYMDAIRLHSVGIKNAVAIMGTSLTKEQVQALKKLHAKIILMLDNDSAGEEATQHIGTLLEEQNLDFGIVRLSGEKDPDEYILKNGKEAMINNIKNAISFTDFKLNYFKKNKNLNDANDLAEYIKVVLDSLKNSKDTILKEVVLQKLSEEYHVSYAVLKSELGSTEVSKEEVVLKDEKKLKKRSSYDKVCTKILYYMMHDKEYVRIYKTKIGIFPTKEYRMIANEILYYLEQYKTISIADFISYSETLPLKNEILTIIGQEEDEVLTETSMMELVSILQKMIKKEEIQKIKKKIKEETDIKEKEKLIEQLAEMKKGSVENERD